MIKLEIELGDVNYEELVEKLMPTAGSTIKKKHRFLGFLLSRKSSGKIAGKTLRRMSRFQQETYVQKLLNKNEKKIISAIEKKAWESGIDLPINSISAKFIK